MTVTETIPTQPNQPNQTIESNDPTTEQANDDTFDSLVESSKALLEALQAWMTATNKRDLRCDINSTCETTMPEVTTPVTELATATIEAAAATTEAATATTEAATATAETATATIEAAVATTEATIATTEATKNSYDPMLLQEFDQAWTSYYNLFQAWKDKDAKRLLQTLLDHAQQIESLWRTVQSDPSARTEWEPRIEEQRRDLRAKAGQLAGAEGTTRLDAIFADFVNSTTSPVITSNAIPPAITSPTTPPTTITSPVATPPTTTPRADTPPTDAPMIDTPIADTQMDDAPATDTPMDDAPATGTPMVGPSVVDTSVADPSVVDTPVVDPSVVDTPVVTSMVDTPMVDTPMVDTPMTDGLTDDISSNATTVTTTPTIGSPIADNSIVDNSIDDNLTVDDSTADESTVVVPTDATTTTTATPLADNSTTDIPTTTIFTPNITIADVISTAATPPVATPPSDLPAPSKPADESSSPSTHVDTIIESPATPAKKRQRASSSKGNVQGESTSQSVLTRANSTGQEHLEGDPAKEVTSPVDQEQPKAKKTAKSKSIPSASVDPAVDVEPVPADLFKSAPPEVEKPEKWSNLRMVHELALDTNFKLEHKKSLIDTAESIGGTAGASVGADGMQSLEARIRAIATKAYFDKIREDAEEGNLGKWIPSLLTTIRDQLLDMLPPTSAMAVQISEGFDIEFVQQQVDKNVYDIKAALESVLKIMSELCAPVRDPAIRELMDDLSQISKDPLTNDFDDISSSASTVTDTARYSAAYVAPKDLVSVLQGILELLELMLMDLANFRLTMARPKLEKEAVPYEQNAFKDSLRKNKTLLDTTKIWLEESAKKVLQQHSSTTAASLATAAAATSSTDGGENGHNGAHRHIYYEILVHGILDLVFSSKHFDVSPDREMFPSTLALDRERMSRYQNEVQGLAMVAIILNISLNVPPVLKDDEQKELKLTLLRLMESPRTSVETLAEAVIEAKEKSLLSAARRVESSSRSSSPLGNSYSSSSSSSQQSPTGKLLLTSEEKSYIHNAISRAISFDSTLYKVLSDRVRKALESVMISAIPSSVSNNNPSYVRVGHMPDQVSMRKMGLGALTSEIETLAGQIRFLTKYNAQVYRQWYDPMLNGIIIDLTTSSSSSA
ncbi:hypothetical protein BGZ46_005862 [Entomortierella lignicola]|nr:hypothetical protein BGZ46_005862 [Entomortierella lignicola]